VKCAAGKRNGVQNWHREGQRKIVIIDAQSKVLVIGLNDYRYDIYECVSKKKRS
jgi:hypothetical protein